MAYISGTLTDSNAPATLYASVATALTTAGYTLVDTVVISTRTHKVWKNAAANNPANVDWYLDVAYTTTGAGTLGCYPMEFYDPATDLAYRNCFQLTSTIAPETTYYSRWGATGYSLESANLGSYAGSGPHRDMSCPATTFGYWISVTNKRVAYMGTVYADMVYYVGLYEPHSDYAAFCGALLFPLCSIYLTGNSGSPIVSQQACSRYPKETQSINWQTKLGTASYGMNNFPAIPSGSTAMSSQFKATRWTLYGNTGSGGSAVRMGYLYDTGGISAGTVVRGDTVTIGGQPWVLSSPTGNFSVLFAAL